jgi:hypothetical protein
MGRLIDIQAIKKEKIEDYFEDFSYNLEEIREYYNNFKLGIEFINTNKIIIIMRIIIMKIIIYKMK